MRRFNMEKALKNVVGRLYYENEKRSHEDNRINTCNISKKRFRTKNNLII